MAVLQGDQGRFQGPQKQDRETQDEGYLIDQMHPDRRHERHFDDKCESHGQTTDDQNDKNRGPIARIMGRQVQTTDSAYGSDIQQTLEKFAPPAPGTAAHQTCEKGRDHGAFPVVAGQGCPVNARLCCPRPKHRRRKTETAIPHPQNANTRRPLPSQNGGPA